MGLYPGGLLSRIIYSFENGWAYIRGGLKQGGGLKSGILRYLILMAGYKSFKIFSSQCAVQISYSQNSI